jgi:hypothetical protein
MVSAMPLREFGQYLGDRRQVLGSLPDRYDDGEQDLALRVEVEGPYLSRGERPEMSVRKAQRAVKPIKATAQLEIAGDGPGTPSIPELVDIALAEPEFRDWVDRKPSREKFCRDCISVIGWPGPTYENHLWLKDVPNAPPTGVLTVALAQGGVFGTRGIVSMDPWTGEVLDVRLLEGASG